MVGETIDLRTENSEQRDEAIQANIAALTYRQYKRSLTQEGTLKDYCYLDITTAIITFDAEKCAGNRDHYRLTVKRQSDGTVKFYDSSDGQPECGINKYQKEIPLTDSVTFPKEVKSKVLCAAMAYNADQKKKASERRKAQNGRKNGNPKAPATEEKKSLTQRLFKLIRGE